MGTGEMREMREMREINQYGSVKGFWQQFLVFETR